MREEEEQEKRAELEERKKEKERSDLENKEKEQIERKKKEQERKEREKNDVIFLQQTNVTQICHKYHYCWMCKRFQSSEKIDVPTLLPYSAPLGGLPHGCSLETWPPPIQELSSRRSLRPQTSALLLQGLSDLNSSSLSHQIEE